MKNKALFYETSGWYGVSAIIVAYALVSSNIVDSDSLAYQLLNLTGALGIIVLSIHKKVNQSILLNIVWAAIALAAIVTIIV